MKYNSIGEQLIAKAKELDPNYTPDKFNDMSEAIDVILNNTSGGSSTQLYLDVSPYIATTSETGGTITEEGYNLIHTKLNNGEIIGIFIDSTPVPFAYSDEYNYDTNGTPTVFLKLNFIYNIKNRINVKFIIDERTLTWSAETEPISSDSSSIFDITPYLTSKTSMSIEGYNALREFVTSNKGGIVKFNMDEHVMYITCFAVSSDSLIFNYYSVFDNGEYDTTFTAMLVNSEGNITSNNSTLYQVLANPVDDSTDILSKIKINGIVYSIPVGEDYSTEISTLNGRVDTLENNVDVLLGYDINSLDNRVNLLESKSTSFAQASDVNTLDSRVSDIETTIGDINSILDNINGEVI